MGMKKKVLSATLCAVMVGSLAAPAFTVQAADDTLVYWSFRKQLTLIQSRQELR